MSAIFFSENTSKRSHGMFVFPKSWPGVLKHQWCAVLLALSEMPLQGAAKPQKGRRREQGGCAGKGSLSSVHGQTAVTPKDGINLPSFPLPTAGITGETQQKPAHTQTRGVPLDIVSPAQKGELCFPGAGLNPSLPRAWTAASPSSLTQTRLAPVPAQDCFSQIQFPTSCENS